MSSPNSPSPQDDFAAVSLHEKDTVVNIESAKSSSSSSASTKPKKTGISWYHIVGITYFCVGGGPFGFEESLMATNNAALSITFLLAMSLFWAFPQALYITELSSKFTYGYTQWVLVALGDVIGVAHAYIRSICNILTNVLYLVLYQHYLSRILYNKSLDDDTFLERLAMTSPYIATVLFLNIIGVQIVGTATIVISVLVIFPFVLLFIVSFPFLNLGDLLFGYEWSPHIDLGVLFSVLVFNLIGFDDVGNLSGKVRNRNRNLPLGMLVALLLVVTTYMVPSLTVASILNNDFFNNSAVISEESVYVYFAHAALDCDFYRQYLVNRSLRLEALANTTATAFAPGASVPFTEMNASSSIDMNASSSSWECPFTNQIAYMNVLSTIINIDSVVSTWLLGVVYMQTSSAAQAHCSAYGLFPEFVRRPFDTIGWMKKHLCCCCFRKKKQEPHYKMMRTDDPLNPKEEDEDSYASPAKPVRQHEMKSIDSGEEEGDKNKPSEVFEKKEATESQQQQQQHQELDVAEEKNSTKDESEDSLEQPLLSEDLDSSVISTLSEEIEPPKSLLDETNDIVNGRAVPGYAILLQTGIMLVMAHLVDFDEILEIQSFFYCISIMLITVSYVLIKFFLDVEPDSKEGIYELPVKLKWPIIVVCSVICLVCIVSIATFDWWFILINLGALIIVIVLSLLLVKYKLIKINIKTSRRSRS